MSQPLESRAFEMIAVETVGGPRLVPYEVRHSARSRRIRLSLGPRNQAVLTLPPRASLRTGLEFLRSQGDWLERQMRKTPPPATLAAHLAAHPRLSGLGREIALTLNYTSARPFFVFDAEAGEAEFRHPADAAAEPALKKLLFDFARDVLPPRVHELAQRHHQRVRRVSVRDQGTRWGSCSGRGTLSLNWRLVLLPAELHDHVLLHELAHLSEMNHAPSFWSLLRTYDPAAEAHDRALTRASRPLMRLGRA
ncbi:MAG TPA: M48 family metallopeptidase [Opitutales bacterium]|nr:M48 family metallopeptidase [Opitutales bacterium]